ncbi:hypothetical protein QQS21_000157 [Conoideocrella luteorostrata]|uniref:Cytochrome P450 n=1 Tax=Conoideocrella luteorostrata TaxID=1105319 RepID=A0AAJ0D006_9HYPO|nr:hypothetical protein QQS21_000157 [Conoideocrella luteorostrata]
MTASAVFAAAGTYLLYFVMPLALFYIGYCVFLHPLAQYPGPPLARFTEAYGGYLALRKTIHTSTYQSFLKYGIFGVMALYSQPTDDVIGPVVRVAPNRLVFNSIAALQGKLSPVTPAIEKCLQPGIDIYLNPKLRKGTPYHYQPLSTNQRGVQNTIDKDVHKRKRKLIGSVLNERSMRIFESTMSTRVEKFLQLLYGASQSLKPVNIANLSQNLAMDIAASLGFGYCLHLQTNDTYRFITETLIFWMRLINVNMAFPILRYVSRTIMVLQVKKTTKFGMAVKKIIQARMAQGRDAQHDFYSVATEVNADSELFRSEMWAEATAFLAAGGLSTATSISATFFYLSRYPDCYRTLAHEIRTTFACSDDIKAGPQLNGCKYLRACIEEALRCAAPVLLPSWREQDPADQGLFIVDGHVVPRGTQVAVPIYSLLHNQDIFEDPFAYRPERWLEPDKNSDTEDKKSSRVAMRKAFIPFMIGDRNCAGQAMAWMELSLVVARVLWYFDFEKAPGKLSKLGEKLRLEAGREVPEYEISDIFVAEHDGPNLIFREREGLAKELETKFQ